MSMEDMAAALLTLQQQHQTLLQAVQTLLQPAQPETAPGAQNDQNTRMQQDEDDDWDQEDVEYDGDWEYASGAEAWGHCVTYKQDNRHGGGRRVCC